MSIEPEASGRNSEINRYTAEIVAAYVAKNHTPRSDVAALIVLISDAVRRLYAPPQIEAKRSLPSKDEIRRSVSQDFITSFIDGKRYKSIKRHLRTHGLDPAGYRSRYGLPVDYPMVAPTYSARRSEISRGLGAKKREQS